MSVSAARGIADEPVEREVKFKTADGWEIVGALTIPNSKQKAPGVLLIHGSRHEGDAYGQVTSPGLPRALSQRGIAVLRIDIRGRGASRQPQEFHSMTPAQRQGVQLDVAAAVNFLATQARVNGKRIGVVAEQDSADAALIAATGNRRVVAYTLLSGRLSPQAKKSVAAISTPIFCIVSKEDRRGFKDMTDVYLSAKNKHSRLKVFEGLGLGTTMFSAWQYEFPDEQPIEEMIGIWLAERLRDNAGVSSASAKKR
jgi:dienelactone hydrolase